MAQSFSMDEHLKKRLGKRKSPQNGFEAGMQLQNLVNELSDKPQGIIPRQEKGVHRFSSFEEADAWMIKVIAKAANL